MSPRTPVSPSAQILEKSSVPSAKSHPRPHGREAAEARRRGAAETSPSAWYIS